MSNIKIHPILKEIALIFKQHNKRAYLVGGSVRDMILKKPAVDWDIATNALVQEVQTMFHRVIPTGIKHGTVTILYKGNSIEVTTFRTEGFYGDGRRPDKVEWTSSIEDDLSRRDFTMNAIAADLSNGAIVDPFNGSADIKNRVIRCVGNAIDRFNEDGLRPMRAVRFVSQLGFDPDKELLCAIPKSLAVVSKVSAERIRDEINKIIMSANPGAAFKIMEETGLMRLLLPELFACRGVLQKGFHRFDVLTHSLLACDYAAKANEKAQVRIAGLFHDIGKPNTAKLNSKGIWTFYNHERISAEMTFAILTRLRYPNDFRDAVVHLIKEHMFHYEDNWSNAAVRRFIARVGNEFLPDIYALRRADFFASAGLEPPADLLLSLQDRIAKVLDESGVLGIKDLAINGHDLLDIGLPAGKSLGIILNQLLEAVLDDPKLNTKEKLIEIATAIEKDR